MSEDENGSLEKIVRDSINENFAVLLAFDMADHNMTFEEYIKKLREHNKLRVVSNDS